MIKLTKSNVDPKAKKEYIFVNPDRITSCDNIRKGETRVNVGHVSGIIVEETPEEINAMINIPPAYSLSIPDNMTEKAREALQEAWEETFEGNAPKLLLIPEKLKLQKLEESNGI